MSYVLLARLDVRQEAVKQALEQYGARPIPSSKRALNPQTKSKISREKYVPFSKAFIFV